LVVGRVVGTWTSNNRFYFQFVGCNTLQTLQLKTTWNMQYFIFPLMHGSLLCIVSPRGPSYMRPSALYINSWLECVVWFVTWAWGLTHVFINANAHITYRWAWTCCLIRDLRLRLDSWIYKCKCSYNLSMRSRKVWFSAFVLGFSWLVACGLCVDLWLELWHN